MSSVNIRDFGTHAQVLVIGGGPAGLAAAIAAREAGIEKVLIIERDRMLGGILNQCIHNGFGLHTFHEELTGPEYAARFIKKAVELEIPYLLGTMVLSIDRDRHVTVMGDETGILTLTADAVVLAMGCRERPRGALNIPGYRPAGIYTAGTAQRLMNIEGFRIGKRAVILGSGDIGLIMARRMTLEGAKVKVVAELMPYSGGLKRNIVQCLDDYGIPLRLSHTVTKIHGKNRVEGVTISEVGPDRKPIPGTDEFYSCDTLLLSCGLLPENELSKQAGVSLNRVTGGPDVDDSLETSVPGVFACGNVLHVHDLVDYVSAESEQAGKAAAAYLQGLRPAGEEIRLENGFDVSYTVPQHFHRGGEALELFFRVRNVRKNTAIRVMDGDTQIARFQREHMAPGEMESIKLPKVLLDRVKGDRLTVETEPVGGGAHDAPSPAAGDTDSSLRSE